MRRIALFLLVLLVMAPSLQAQTIDDVGSMLQFVIDRPEMEQVLNESAIDGQLYIVRTPVLPQQLELSKFGQDVEIITEEDAFFRDLGYVAFTNISTSGSSTVGVEALVKRSEPDDGITVSLVLKRQQDDWRLESFDRAN